MVANGVDARAGVAFSLVGGFLPYNLTSGKGAPYTNQTCQQLCIYLAGCTGYVVNGAGTCFPKAS